MSTNKEPDYVLITVPTESNRERTWQNALTKTEAYATAYKFDVPELKVGSMNTLIKEAEGLGKNDSYAEKTVRRIARQLETLLTDKERAAESLQAAGKTTEGYLTSFKWDAAKFNVNTSLKGLCEDVISKVADIDAEMKKKVATYNKAKQALNVMEKEQTGALMTRSLDGLVKKEDFVVDSDFLQTVVVVVPLAKRQQWAETYESMHESVVPRSTKELYTDDTAILFSVTLFKRPESAVKEFSGACSLLRFVMREYSYDSDAMESREKNLVEAKADVMKKYNGLVRWCTTMFGEAYIAWVHTKALRLFVESVLRYGLPVNFVPILIKPKPKTYAKLRSTLSTTYAHLDANASQGDVEIPSMAIANEIGAYYPYVNVDFQLALL